MSHENLAYPWWSFYHCNQLEDNNDSVFLSLYDKQYIREPLHEKLSSHSFSALERLCIKSMSKESLKQLIKSCPKLKSIQFPSGNDYHEIPNKVLYNAFKDKDIFIIFDEAIPENDQNNCTQKSFEDYLVAHDLKEFKRYRRVKKDFSKWCETNFGYGYWTFKANETWNRCIITKPNSLSTKLQLLYFCLIFVKSMLIFLFSSTKVITRFFSTSVQIKWHFDLPIETKEFRQ